MAYNIAGLFFLIFLSYCFIFLSWHFVINKLVIRMKSKKLEDRVNMFLDVIDAEYPPEEIKADPRLQEKRISKILSSTFPTYALSYVMEKRYGGKKNGQNAKHLKKENGREKETAAAGGRGSATGRPRRFPR